MSGQAQNVYLNTERNGWKTLSFELPSTYDTENGQEKNYRLDAIKADYLLHTIEFGLDANSNWEVVDSDWYIISEPKVVHTGFARNIQVNAGHVSQLLKTKNLGLEFSDENGDNGGTAGELVAKCLEGTGWSLGDVATFYENDGETVKFRTLKANAKTGTFKLIASICELFDAKPVYHGETRKVDILPLNPFSEPEPGQLPDVTKADGVIELHYGTNLSSVSRTLNTENLITKLYAYGSYGDTTSGYCGIDEVKHQEFVFT